MSDESHSASEQSPAPHQDADLRGFSDAAARDLFESRFWTQHYPPGVEANLEPLCSESLLGVMKDTLKKYASRPAFVTARSEFTYADVDRLSDAFAGYLKQLGVQPKEVVAIMLPNLVQFPVCLIGAMKLGCVLTNVNPLYTVRELHHHLKDSNATTIVVFESFAKTLQDAMPDTAIKNVIVTNVGDLIGGFKGALINFVVKTIKKKVPAYQLPNAVGLKRALDQGKGQEFVTPSTGLDDVVLLQYTGGTTGLSKGAMLTNRNVVSNLQQGLQWMRQGLGDKPLTIVTMLPLYHIYALSINCVLFMTLGARNILIANPRDVGTVMKALKGETFHVITAVNTLFNAFLNNEEFCKRDFSALRFALSGGMALQEPIAKRWYEVTKCAISEGYGLTETSPVVTVPPMHGQERPVFRGSVGLPLPGTEVRLRDLEGKWLGLYEPGEICIRGSQVMPGYLNLPDETAKAIDSAGWFASGDIGEMDEMGYLKIVDRKKDMIIVSGFNVYPNEVESLVAAHPGVLECAVVGVPHEVTGEKVKLVVVRKHPELSEEELLEYCRGLLTGYKVPSFIEFRSDLPKTPVGKILRRELR